MALCGQFIDPDVDDRLIYVDTDVVFLVEMEPLLEINAPLLSYSESDLIEEEIPVTIKWNGETAAFMIIFLSDFRSLLTLHIPFFVASADASNHRYPFGLDDQQIIAGINRLPGKSPISRLSPPHLFNGHLVKKDAPLPSSSEARAFLHFNGGPSIGVGDEDAIDKPFWGLKKEEWVHVKKKDWANEEEGWRLAKYYIDLPWKWIKGERYEQKKP